MFFERYVDLCKEKNVSLSKAAEDNGLSRTSVVKWKKGAIPSGATIQKLAAYFGVTADYLIGNVKEPYFYLDKDVNDYGNEQDIKEAPHINDEKGDTIKRIIELCDKSNKTDMELERDMNLPDSSIYKWRNNQSKSYERYLLMIANYFGVSADYLLGASSNTASQSTLYNDEQQTLKEVYFNFAKEAQDNGIDPQDIRLAMEAIKIARGKK